MSSTNQYDTMTVSQPKLKHPFNMIVCGQSGAGKTSFIHKLLLNLEAVTEQQYGRILYAYGVFQPLYREIAKIPNVEMVEGTVKDMKKSDVPTLVVFDDLFLETTKDTASLFTRLRHLNLSTIFVCQNFFHDCKYMRTVTRNAHYLVFFRNPRDVNQIATLSRQMFPGNSRFLPEALKQPTVQPFSYLFIDLKPTTDERLRVCNDIFSDEHCTYFQPL